MVTGCEECSPFPSLLLVVAVLQHTARALLSVKGSGVAMVQSLHFFETCYLSMKWGLVQLCLDYQCKTKCVQNVYGNVLRGAAKEPKSYVVKNDWCKETGRCMLP